MSDSLTDIYYSKIMETDKPIPLLASFCFQVLNINLSNPKVYGIIGKLYNLYGSKRVFFSILDCADMPDVDFNDTVSLTKLLSYFCKKRLEASLNFNKENSLQGMVDNYRKILSREGE